MELTSAMSKVSTSERAGACSCTCQCGKGDTVSDRTGSSKYGKVVIDLNEPFKTPVSSQPFSKKGSIKAALSPKELKKQSVKKQPMISPYEILAEKRLNTKTRDMNNSLMGVLPKAPTTNPKPTLPRAKKTKKMRPPQQQML